MQILNIGERKFTTSKGELKPQEIIDLPDNEAEKLQKMFIDEIKVLEVKPKTETEKQEVKTQETQTKSKIRRKHK